MKAIVFQNGFQGVHSNNFVSYEGYLIFEKFRSMLFLNNVLKIKDTKMTKYGIISFKLKTISIEVCNQITNRVKIDSYKFYLDTHLLVWCFYEYGMFKLYIYYFST